jgi:NitT/TauT family transport system substrate-binding protein/putative hydroxymethylpyrimidine transport system substrate-binding protein
VARRPSRRATAVVAALLVAGCGGGGGGEEPTVRLALDFTPNAAHSGIFAALQGDRDRAHGVRLSIRQPSASTDSLKLLTTGRADLAVLDIHDLGLARERGQDLVGVAALVQRPLAAVIAGPDVSRPRALEGRRVGVTGLPSDDAVLRAVVEGDGGRFDRVRRVTIGFSAVPSLVARKVAAATAFWSVEGVALRARGVRTHEFRVDRFGAPRYPELVIVATRAELRARRGAIRRALAAIADGTRAALRAPGAAASTIARAAQADPSLVRAEYAAIRPALSPPLRLDRRALAGWAAFDVRFGILKRKPDLAKTFDFSLIP